MTDSDEVGLFETIAMLESAEEAERFFMDLCTPQEIRAFKERYSVCQLLYSQKFSYREISKMTGASTTTVSRVAKFLNDGPYNGYLGCLRKCEERKKGC